MHEEATAVGRPSLRDHGADHVLHREVDSLPRVEVPDRRSFDPGPLLGEEEPPDAGRGRPGDRLHPELRVDLVARALTGSTVEDPERLPVDVAVLGVMDTDQRAVGRESAAALRPLAAHSRRLRVAVDLARGLIPDRDEDPVVVVGRETGGDTSVDDGDAHHPSVVEAPEEGSRFASFEGR